MTSLLRRTRLVLPLSMLLALLLPALALGHAELVASSPPDGGTISQGDPQRLVAEFSEDLATSRSRIVVRDAAGAEVARGDVSEDDPRVMIVELTGVAAGDYSARWTAVTPADNGVTRGTIEFTIAAPTVTDRSAEPTGSASPSAGATAVSTPTPTTTPAATPTGDGEPAASTADVLIALLVAGALLAAVLAYVWRRRAA